MTAPTIEQVAELALEAAGITDNNIPMLACGRLETGYELLERFAALAYAAGQAAGQAAEREACAKVCEAVDAACFPIARGPAAKCAAAIRARGDTMAPESTEADGDWIGFATYTGNGTAQTIPHTSPFCNGQIRILRVQEEDDK
jgi:hypothetical protein